MKRLLALAPSVFALSIMSWPQAPSDSQNTTTAALPQNSTTAPESLAPGTVLSAELSVRLDVKKYKVNDKIEARIVKDLFMTGFAVYRNTKIIGHVTEVKASSKASPGSMVEIVLDRMILKGGREIPVVMTIQAIAPPSYTSGYFSEPDSLAGKPTTRHELPPVGAPAPATGSASPIDDRSETIPAPPSINVGGSSTSRSAVGPLGSRSRGVIGIEGLTLGTSGRYSVLGSATGNLHVESGSQLILRVQ